LKTIFNHVYAVGQRVMGAVKLADIRGYPYV